MKRKRIVETINVKTFYVSDILRASFHVILITTLQGYTSIHLVDEKTERGS